MFYREQAADREVALAEKLVTLTLCVHDGSASGPIIQDAQVTGQDGSGNSFEQTTDSNGYVTITGDPGTWSFSVSADGYETNSWDQEITVSDTKDAYLQEEEPEEVIRTNEYLDNSTAVYCDPGSKRATCPSKYYCVDCSRKCIPSGTDVGGGWSCEEGKWNFQPGSLSDIGAYRTENSCSVKDKEDTNMKIGNVMYDRGLQVYAFYTAGSGVDYYYVYFNLNGEFSRLTGLVGLDDNNDFNRDVNVTFIGDGRELQTFTLQLGDFPVEVDIDVSGVHQLIVRGTKAEWRQLLDLINMDLVK
jgi:hypothetical protein